MTEAIVDKIQRELFLRGVFRSDAAVASVALLVAWREDPSGKSPQEMFRHLAARLSPQSHNDGLTAAKEWLEDPGFAAMQWEALGFVLEILRHSPSSPIDWSGELAAAMGDGRKGLPSLGPSIPIARAINRMLDIPITARCAFVFPWSAPLAWSLAADQEATLFASERDLAIIVALLARAACRPLLVDRRNPYDSSFMPGHVVNELTEPQPPFEAHEFDYIVTVPYAGLRLSAKVQPFETAQIEWFAPLARRCFASIITDGALFRENKIEMAARQSIVETYSTTVQSLPIGMFAPASTMATSLIRLEPGPSSRRALMIDGRSIDISAPGKTPELAIVKHLDQFSGLIPRDDSRTAIVNWQELQENSFSLLPDRYVHSEGLAQIAAALQAVPQIELGSIASIERAKSPTPLREATEDRPLTAMEIAPADIVDGFVRTPSRQLAFAADQAAALAKVTVRDGDILVSIKGNVGIVGMVGMDAEVAKITNDPWIVSQSLAIIRLEDRDKIGSPELLHAMLTAPWVREKLDRMSGGTTVRTLPISTLRALAIPVPSLTEGAAAMEDLGELKNLRQRIQGLSENLDTARADLWHRLWHLPREIGDE